MNIAWIRLQYYDYFIVNYAHKISIRVIYTHSKAEQQKVKLTALQIELNKYK